MASSATRRPILLWSNLSAWPLFLLWLLVAAVCLVPPARADLKPEIQDSMFQGTIQAMDRESLSLTVRTDFGRVLSLSLPSPESLAGLRIGDRVWLEADAQGLLTVKKFNPHAAPLLLPAGRAT